MKLKVVIKKKIISRKQEDVAEINIILSYRNIMIRIKLAHISVLNCLSLILFPSFF